MIAMNFIDDCVEKSRCLIIAIYRFYHFIIAFTQSLEVDNKLNCKTVITSSVLDKYNLSKLMINLRARAILFFNPWPQRHNLDMVAA